MIAVSCATAASPGAIAILQLHGEGVGGLLRELTGKKDWRPGVMRLVDFGGIDDGLAVLLKEDFGQLMPHGGLLVVQKLLEKLVDMGASVWPGEQVNARDLYPEARSQLEADMLATMAKAASPGAVDLLAEQVGLWGKWVAGGCHAGDIGVILKRTKSLDLLVDPPAVALVGGANVGKSTLTNRMLGRSASVVADLPGTTRDWVGGLAEIGEVAVRWIDTPGVRESDDVIEQHAIELAGKVLKQAEVLIAMRDDESGWPGGESLPRQVDLWVVNKVDRMQVIFEGRDGKSAEKAMGISAETGEGVDELGAAVVKVLGLGKEFSGELWAFSDGLKRLLGDGDVEGLWGYVGVST